MQIIKEKNRLHLVPSLIDIRAKHLTQGIGTEMTREKACENQMIDNMDGKSPGALSYKVTVTAHFFILDKEFTHRLFHNMLLKQQENNALGINVMAHKPQFNISKEPYRMGEKIPFLIKKYKNTKNKTSQLGLW